MNHIAVPLMSRAFFHTYAMQYGCEWMAWLGGGSIDNTTTIETRYRYVRPNTRETP